MVTSNLGRPCRFALLLAIMVLFAVAQNSDSAEISQLLSEAEHHAVLLDDDAATLQSYTRSNLQRSY